MVNNPVCPILLRTIIMFLISASGDSFKYCCTDIGCETINNESLLAWNSTLGLICCVIDNRACRKAGSEHL